MKRIKLGKTEIDQETFECWIAEMGSSQYRANQYELFKHNCNNFSEDVAQFLGKHIMQLFSWALKFRKIFDGDQIFGRHFDLNFRSVDRAPSFRGFCWTSISRKYRHVENFYILSESFDPGGNNFNAGCCFEYAIWEAYWGSIIKLSNKS